MKKLFVAFMVLGFLASSCAWAGKNDADDSAIGSWMTNQLKDGGGFISKSYTNIMRLVRETTGSLENAAYYKMSSIMYSEIIFSLLGIIIFFWLYKQMGKGGISKEDAYKAITFTIIFIIVYVILGSKTAYNEVMAMFKLPSKILQEVFGGQSSIETALVKVFGEPFMKTFEVGFKCIFRFYRKSQTMDSSIHNRITH